MFFANLIAKKLEFVLLISIDFKDFCNFKELIVILVVIASKILILI